MSITKCMGTLPAFYVSIYHVLRYDPSLARFEDPPADEKPKDADDLTHCPSCVRYQKLEDVSVYSKSSTEYSRIVIHNVLDRMTSEV